MRRLSLKLQLYRDATVVGAALLTGVVAAESKTSAATTMTGAAASYEHAWIALMCSAIAGTLGTCIYFSSLVRSKNTLATIGQVIVCLCISAMTWVTVKEIAGLAFSTTQTGAAADAARLSTIASSHQIMALLIIVSGLIIGGAVERMKLSAVVVLAIVWSAFVFAPLAALMWGINVAHSLKVMQDWGGASAHLAAGAFAFGIALAVGPRMGYGRVPMPPYHMALALVGGMCLFIGWSGYNEFGVTPRVKSSFSGTMNSIVAASAGLVVWASIEHFSRRVTSTLGMVSGVLASLVAIFAVAGWVSPLVAMLIGASGSVAGYVGAVVLRRAHSVDDSLDVLGIHALPAMAGLLCASILTSTSVSDVAVQLGWIVLIALYSFAIGWLSAFLLKKLSALRVSFDEEDAGLDLVTHGETVHPPQSTL